MKITATIQPRSRISELVLALVAGLVLMCGCKSLPEGSPEVKQRALSFSPPTGKAGVYVIRPGAGSAKATSFLINLDFQEFGSLNEKYYLFSLVGPGNHALTVPLAGPNAVRFPSEVGKNYFFTVKPTLLHGVQIKEIPEPEGRAYVRKFKLSGYNRFELENTTEQENRALPVSP